MSSSVERLAVVEHNYRQAKDNEAADLSRAQTEIEVAGIQANVANARLAYFDAAAQALGASGPAVEAAFTAARHAQATIKTSRESLELIPTLLGKLASGTAAAQKLIAVAKA
jgi:hypothetical protein